MQPAVTCVYPRKMKSSEFLHLDTCTSTCLNACPSALLHPHPCPKSTPKLPGPTGAGIFMLQEPLSCCWECSSSQGMGKQLFFFFFHQINPPLPMLAHGKLAQEQVRVHSLEAGQCHPHGGAQIPSAASKFAASSLGNFSLDLFE